MRRKRLLGIAWVAAALLIAAPVAAADFTGHEEDESDPYGCWNIDPETGERSAAWEDGSQPAPDDDDDCPIDSADDQTYTVTVWDNDVTCNDGAVAPLPVGNVYATGDPTALEGGVGVCNDGDAVPVQGRVVVGGSEEHGGVFVYADGDRDNEAPADGWARGDVTTDGPTVGCGPDGSDAERDASVNAGAQDPGNCG